MKFKMNKQYAKIVNGVLDTIRNYKNVCHVKKTVQFVPLKNVVPVSTIILFNSKTKIRYVTLE